MQNQVSINIDDEDVQQAIQQATKAAFKEIVKLLDAKGGSVSMQFSDQLKIEMQTLLSRYAVVEDNN